MEPKKAAERLKKLYSGNCNCFKYIMIEEIFTKTQIEKIKEEFSKITSFQIIDTKILPETNQTVFYIL